MVFVEKPLVTIDIAHGIDAIVVGTTKDGKSRIFVSLCVGKLRTTIGEHIPGVKWK